MIKGSSNRKKKENSIKNYVDSVLSINISHLHDASNFFSLIKNDLNSLQETCKSPEPESKDLVNRINDVRNFAKGAAYHFRSLFEELKSSKELFDTYDFDELLKEKEKLNILYQKEVVDLKDLLELELFQVSNIKRLKIDNRVSKEHALISGNFSLLSKVLLNLIENALRYTEDEIKLELGDKERFWELKLISYGKSMPDLKSRLIGDGLSSVMHIAEFHDAAIDISTLKDQGSCVTLKFKKYASNNALRQSLNYGRTGFSKNLFICAFLSLLMVFVTLASLLQRQRCDMFYKSMVFGDIKTSRTKVKFLEDKENCLVELNRLKISTENPDTEKEFMSHFNKRHYNLVSLVLFTFVYDKDFHYLANNFIDKVMKLHKVYPQSSELNFLVSNFHFTKKSYLLSCLYSLKGFLAILREKLYPDRDLYVINRLHKYCQKNPERDPPIFIDFLASLWEQPLVSS